MNISFDRIKFGLFLSIILFFGVYAIIYSVSNNDFDALFLSIFPFLLIDANVTTSYSKYKPNLKPPFVFFELLLVSGILNYFDTLSDSTFYSIFPMLYLAVGIWMAVLAIQAEVKECMRQRKFSETSALK